MFKVRLTKLPLILNCRIEVGDVENTGTGIKEIPPGGN